MSISSFKALDNSNIVGEKVTDNRFLAILLTSQDSELAKSQIPFLESVKDDLIKSGLSFNQLGFENETLIRGYIDHSSMLAKKNELGELLIILKKMDGQLKIVSVREKPESEYNWVAVFKQFALNNLNSEPDQNKAWRYGQIVPVQGEYMCRDCGYIEEFKAGQLFPVCEVCQSGDPEGPVDTQVGYWEKI